ncbi:MAG TPA: alpha,alpha-trehalase TreF [Cyclobacteriaceae bacterium]|mgnify:CR=1 FL=1|nr:alpha,alpha-trehalase TreF [Cyclobacteriaceae bacterium]HRJ82529.1 alpha,alpha-trehalase TreF [Cyclobacteriaceae bacterium]
MITQIHELGELFEVVQLQNILGDGKTFPDCVPKRSLEEINNDFKRRKKEEGFDLRKFLEQNFKLPAAYSAGYQSDLTKSAQQHIENLWDVLTRTPDETGGSLIPLPHPYLVPGGRFREIYYWDSYFTMLGLQASGKIEMIRNMIDNFAFLIDMIGYIPNGNRTYFIGRSQPPFFSLMVKLLHSYEADALSRYLPQLEKEYDFWMHGANSLRKNQSVNRVVKLPDDSVLNRYWDEHDTPRPESYKEDVELAHQSSQKPNVLFRHLRAAAESGWDFSSRWFKDVTQFSSIHTTEIIPVDLNCLLYHLEQTLSDAYRETDNNTKADDYFQRALIRKNTIQKYCWSYSQNFFFDFDFIELQQKANYTLAAAFPLFFEVATPEQALAVGQVLEEKFLKHGGLTTTLEHSGQQWDAPNGWAPLQWIAYTGLLKYSLTDLASKLKANWLAINDTVYANTGKMTEKYDVWSERGEASGGEYPNQDGFGWTNGVYLAMKNN